MSISKVIENLYITDAETAKIITDNAANDFIVVTCAKELKFMHHDYFVPLYDGRNKEVIRELDNAYNFIKAKIEKGEKVVVHCQAGVSRSAIVIIYYLMKSQNINYDNAYKLLKNVRPIINPNHFFENILYKLK